MQYTELLEYISTPRTDYWETVIKSKDAIISQLNISNQGIMARELGLHQPQLSIVIKMLRAIK